MPIVSVIGSGKELAITVPEDVTVLTQNAPEQLSVKLLGLTDETINLLWWSMYDLGLLPHQDEGHPKTKAIHTGLIHVNHGEGGLNGIRQRLTNNSEKDEFEICIVPAWGVTFTSGALLFEQMVGGRQE